MQHAAAELPNAAPRFSRPETMRPAPARLADAVSYSNRYLPALSPVLEQTTRDGLRLHAWMMWPRHWSAEERRRRPTVLFCQENAGNMAFRYV